jgi:hypothetical protein
VEWYGIAFPNFFAKGCNTQPGTTIGMTAGQYPIKKGQFQKWTISTVKKNKINSVM